MNGLRIAALVGVIAELVFIIAALRSGEQREHRIWIASGLALLAAMFAIGFYDLGNLLQQLHQDVEQLGEATAGP